MAQAEGYVGLSRNTSWFLLGLSILGVFLGIIMIGVGLGKVKSVNDECDTNYGSSLATVTSIDDAPQQMIGGINFNTIRAGLEYDVPGQGTVNSATPIYCSGTSCLINLKERYKVGTTLTVYYEKDNYSTPKTINDKPECYGDNTWKALWIIGIVVLVMCILFVVILSFMLRMNLHMHKPNILPMKQEFPIDSKYSIPPKREPFYQLPNGTPCDSMGIPLSKT